MHVYVIEHIPSGRVYVGKANDVQKRWTAHRRKARTISTGSYFHAAIRKYGEEEFCVKHVFSFGCEKDAYDAEILVVRALKADIGGRGFNLESGGQGGKRASNDLRATLSAAATKRWACLERRAEQSLRLTGTVATKEARNNMSASHKHRRPISEETRHKQSLARTGTTHTPEAKAKISAANSGRKASLETRAKMAKAQQKRRAPEKEAA